MSRCVGHEGVQRKLKKLHGRTYGFCGKINLYRRLQRTGFYWLDMVKDVNLSKPSVRPVTWL